MRVDCFIAQSIQSIPDTQSPLVPLAFVENLLFFGHLKSPQGSQPISANVHVGYKAKIEEISERSLRCECMLHVNENKFRVISTHGPLYALKFCEVQLKIQGFKSPGNPWLICKPRVSRR